MIKLKMMIRQNIINNFPVMVEYIEITDNIFDPDVSTLKGRTTRQRPKVVVEVPSICINLYPTR